MRCMCVRTRVEGSIKRRSGDEGNRGTGVFENVQ